VLTTMALTFVGTSLGAAAETLETPDVLAPSIVLSSPGAGDWTTLGDTSLVAHYDCTDEDGGSGLDWCAGPTASGDAVPATSLGVLNFAVSAGDLAGNVATASADYLVFRSAEGSLVRGDQARAGSSLSLTLGMDLPPDSDPLATMLTQQVDCASGSVLGDPEAATITHLRLTHKARKGGLSVRWDTDPAWGGQCRTLAVSFDVGGWSGAPAIFGPIRFA
jgi:hypothetical protein